MDGSPLKLRRFTPEDIWSLLSHKTIEKLLDLLSKLNDYEKDSPTDYFDNWILSSFIYAKN